jgi:hypothetical protein
MYMRVLITGKYMACCIINDKILSVEQLRHFGYLIQREISESLDFESELTHLVIRNDLSLLVATKSQAL